MRLQRFRRDKYDQKGCSCLDSSFLCEKLTLNFGIYFLITKKCPRVQEGLTKT